MVIASLWPKRRLGELVIFKTGKLDSNAAVLDGRYPFFTCSQDTLRTNTYSFDTECVLLAGNNANGVFPLKYFSGKFDAYQRTYVIRPRDSTVLTTRFLYYSLRPKLSEFRSFSTGAATKFLTLTILNGTQIELPPLRVQRKIASVLSRYDDLIENNTHRIHILEEMARTIYEEWFVRFRFPGHQKIKMIDSELGKIPEGWRVAPFIEAASIQREGINPSQFPEEVFAHYSIPAFDGARLPSLEPGRTIRSTKYAVSRDSVLLSKLNPRIPRIWLPNLEGTSRAIASTEFLVLLPNVPFTRTYLFGLCSSPEFLGRFIGRAMGTSTSHQRVKPDDLLNLPIVQPPSNVTGLFSRLGSPMFDNVQVLRVKNMKLRRTRDLLLPKLISGEIDVSNIKTEEAMLHA